MIFGDLLEMGACKCGRFPIYQKRIITPYLFIRSYYIVIFAIHLCKNVVCGSWTFASGLWDADKTLWQRQVVLAPSPIPEFKTLVPRRTKEMPTLTGHLPTTAHMFILNYYMHVFVHVSATIITIEIYFHIFIHNQDCPHMSCFLGECKWPICFFWCLDPFVASVFLHIEIYP